MEGQIQLIKMDMIDRPVKISREIIDPERVRELAESIRESGLIQPVILRPSNGRYEMVAGDRRFLAHKLLNIKEIKAIVKDLDDRETVIIRGIENLQRVNLTPSEEGRVYLDLHKEGGLTKKEIARRTGRSENTIERYLNIATLPEEVRRAIDKKDISILAVEKLQEIDDPVAFEYYFKMAVNGGINAVVAEMWVQDYYRTKEGNYYSDGGDNPNLNVEIEAKPIYMTCEVCHTACEIKLIRNLVVCPDCRKKVKHQ